MLFARTIMVPMVSETIPPFSGSLDLFENGVNYYLPAVIDAGNNVVWQGKNPRMLKASARIEAEMFIRAQKNKQKVA